MKILSAILLTAFACMAQVTNPAISVQQDPGGACALGSAPQINVATGQNWNCVPSTSGNLTIGAWTKSSPADTIQTITADPTGNACTPKAIALRTPNGTFYTCQNGTYATATGGGTPTGPCGGDLSGTYPNCAIKNPITNTFIGNATGTTAQLSQSVPASNGCKYLWASQNADATHGPFDAVVDTNLFVATQDEALAIGYNVACGGGRVLTGEPSYRWKTEQNYDNSTIHAVESYFEWASADGLQQKRPIFWQWDRATGNMTLFQITSTGLTFSDWGTGATTANLTSTGLNMAGLASQTVDTSIVVSAQNGHNAFFQMSGGWLVQKYMGNWQINTGGGTAGNLQFDTGLYSPNNDIYAINWAGNYTHDNDFTYKAELTGSCSSSVNACDNGAQQGWANFTASVGNGGNRYTEFRGVALDIADTGSQTDHLAAFYVHIHPTNGSAPLANRRTFWADGGEINNSGPTADSTSYAMELFNSGSTSLLSVRDDGLIVHGGTALTSAAPTVAAAQVGIGSTTATVANCGATATACLVINVAGTTRYIPYY